ncbi:MAG: hypothetical protein J7J52_06120 [Deltaproteobacteria bacterium]|nr:hypothetical protein [Deltaproteobacteria bacterium]
MKKTNVIVCSLFLLSFLFGCSASVPVKKDDAIVKLDKSVHPAVSVQRHKTVHRPSVSKRERRKATEDTAGYQLKPVNIEMKEGRPYLPVGAEVLSDKGKVPLNEVIKELADLQGFSVSWADDVDQKQLVDVNIRPEDDFWEAMNNVLRQLDYFYEINKNTIVIKHKETKTYHLAMPFIQENFDTDVGGDLLGGEETHDKMSGKVKVTGKMTKPLDFWEGVKGNLTKIIGDSGSMVVDRPLGIITVTAPKKIHAKVAAYLDNLKKEMYRQVTIEAKIIEVRLNDKSELGIDWSDVMQRVVSSGLTFGTLYPTHSLVKMATFYTTGTGDLGAMNQFSVVADAMKTYGTTNILSSPKITLLNGHAANITVGKNVTYVNKVESDVTTGTSNTISYTVETSTILSGLGLAVMVNIIDDKNLVLYVVPITAELTEPMVKQQFGSTATGYSEVGLPEVKLRDMATMAKLKDGQMLIIGGLIDKTVNKNELKVPILGDIPFLGKLFQHTVDQTVKRELVILLLPRIISPDIDNTPVVTASYQ